MRSEPSVFEVKASRYLQSLRRVDTPARPKPSPYFGQKRRTANGGHIGKEPAITLALNGEKRLDLLSPGPIASTANSS